MSTRASDRSRQSAGKPTGGQFAPEARPGAEVSLEPPASYPTSGHLPDPEAYSWPAGVPRHLALTAYDDELGTYTLGDVLEVSAPACARSYWIDENYSPLSVLRSAGVHGHLDVSSPDAPYGDGRQWEGRLDLPGGGRLEFTNDASAADPLGISKGVWVSNGIASNTWLGMDEAPEVLHEKLAGVVRLETIEQDAFDRVRALSDRPLQVQPPLVSQGEDGLGQLRGLVSSGRYGFTVAFDAEAGAVDAPVVFEDRQRVQVAPEEAWALMARKAGVMGGRRGRAPQRLREAVTRAVADAGEHPNMAWVRQAYESHTYGA